MAHLFTLVLLWFDLSVKSAFCSCLEIVPWVGVMGGPRVPLQVRGHPGSTSGPHGGPAAGIEVTPHASWLWPGAPDPPQARECFRATCSSTRELQRWDALPPVSLELNLGNLRSQRCPGSPGLCWWCPHAGRAGPNSQGCSELSAGGLPAPGVLNIKLYVINFPKYPREGAACTACPPHTPNPCPLHPRVLGAPLSPAGAGQS